MKQVVVLCALVGVAVYATTAWAAPGSTDPTVSRLVKQVSTLQKQVSTLQKGQKTLTKDLNTVADVALGSFLYTVCSDEITSDAFEGTWQIVDQLATAQTEAPGKTYFGLQTPVTATLQGQDVCSSGGITRSQVLPPTVAQYQALLAPFHTSSDRFRAAALSLFARGLHLK